MSTLKFEAPRAFVPLLQRKRYKGAYGGRGSGKSHFFGEHGILRCVESPTRIVCIREVQNSIKDSVRQLLIDKIQAKGLGSYFDVTRDEVRGPGGSLMVFRGMNDANAENIKSLEGFDVAWVEEAHTLSQRSLDLLRPTIRKEGSEIWAGWNPRHAYDPIDEFFRKRKPADAVSVQVNYNDNPWFPDVLRAEMEADRLADPAKARHVWDGGYEPAPKGSYYGDEMAQAEAEGRITDLMLDPALPVHTAWDLGVGGNMAAWFFQVAHGQFRWVDFHEFEVPGLPHAASVLRQKQAERRFVYGVHLWPHDGSGTEIGSGERRCDTMENLGFKVEVLTRASDGLGDGIEATRRMLRMSHWDRDRCAKGLDHIRGYRRKYDKLHDRFLDVPDKNGHDHAADAKRTAAMGQHKLTNNAGAWSKEIMDFEFKYAG